MKSINNSLSHINSAQAHNYTAKVAPQSRRSGNMMRQDDEQFEPFESISLPSIWLGLKKPSLGLLLFLIGFNGIYFLPLLFPRALNQNLQDGTYRYYLLSFLLVCLGGLLETHATKLWIVRHRPFWVFMLLSSFIIVSLKSVSDGENILSIFDKSVPFYWLLLVPSLGLRKQNWPWLWATILFQAPFAILYSLNTFFFENATTRSELIIFEGQNFISTCLYMAVYSLLLLPAIRNRSLKIYLFCLIGTELLRSLFWAQRLTWILLPLQILILLFIYFRSDKLLIQSSRIIFLLTGFILVAASSLLIIFNYPPKLDINPIFDQAYSQLVNRMLEKATVGSTILENERWIEVRSVVDVMHGWDWLIGKGLAADWRNPLFRMGEKRYMAHNTWLNAFFWGGAILFSTIFFPFIWTLKVFFYSRSTIMLCYSAFLLSIYLKFPAFLTTLVTNEWLLFCLVLGACIRYESISSNRYS